MMRTLILGSSGKIGKHFIKDKNKFIYTYNKHKVKGGIKFNIKKDNLEKLIKKFSIKKVVVLSAVSDPDYCFKNKKRSYHLNVSSTKKIIDKLIDNKIYFIFFSSEMVYQGSKKYYDESSLAKPLNVYGKQKLSVEKYIIKNTNNYSIFRIGKTYSDDKNGKDFFSSFLSSIRKKNFIFMTATDQKFNPIYVKDIVKITNYFLKNKIKGIYNVAGPKTYSRYQCLKIIKNQLPLKYRNLTIIKKTKMSNLKFIEKRPLNLSLKIKKLQKIYKYPITPIEKVAKNIKKI